MREIYHTCIANEPGRAAVMAPVRHRALHAFHADVPEGGSRT